MERTMQFPQDTAARLIEDAIRIRIGHGKRYSFADISDATGIPERTLRSYVDGSTPGLAAILSLCAVLGPGFTNHLLGPIGQSAKQGTSDAPEYMPTLTKLAGLTKELSHALEDGHVDHVERAALRPLAEEMMRMLEPMARPEVNTVPMRGAVV